MWLIQQWHDQPLIPQILASLWLRPHGVLLFVTVYVATDFKKRTEQQGGSPEERILRQKNCILVPFALCFVFSDTGISGGNPWLQSMDGFKTEEWVCWAGRQWFWLSSFPPEHTAQVRVWDFRGIPLVFGVGWKGVYLVGQLRLRIKMQIVEKCWVKMAYLDYK